MFNLEKLPTCLIHVFVPQSYAEILFRRPLVIDEGLHIVEGCGGTSWQGQRFFSIKEQRCWFDIVSSFRLQKPWKMKVLHPQNMGYNL